MKHLFFALFFLSQTLHSNEIYDYIKPIPKDMHGWFGNESQLKEIFAEKKIHTVIELGSWAGCSTIFFGEQVGDNGKVFAIDTWAGSEMEKIHQKDKRIGYLYQLFLSNVKHAQLEDVIFPIRMTTDEAAAALNITADLIYVDADHQTSSVYRDIINWYPHLNEGGVMCGDDWKWESVKKGVKKAAKKLHMNIASEENFWYLYP